MLILTRRAGESIQIGPDITITVLEHGRGRNRGALRIGIDAPDNIDIIRTELIGKENKEDFNAPHSP